MKKLSRDEKLRNFGDLERFGGDWRFGGLFDYLIFINFFANEVVQKETKLPYKSL